MHPDGVLIYDPLLVQRPSDAVKHAYAVPATQIAEGLGRKIAANMVALGAVAALTQIAKAEAFERAVVSRSPRGTEAGNLAALRAGYAAVPQRGDWPS